jgi:hypothetical protein
MSNTLKHIGVLGMKWGRRKSPAQQAHENKVKTLRSQIKSKSNSRFEAEQKKFQKDESAAYSRIEAMKNAKLSAHDKQSKGKFDSLIGRGFIKLNASIDRDNVVSRLEDKLISKSDKRNKAKWSAQQKILKAFDMKAEELYNNRVKGLPFPKDLIESLKLDKEMGMSITEAMLEVELRYS